MKKNIKHLFGIFLLLLLINSCKEKDYVLGSLTAPQNIVITAVIAGQDATHPNGDGTGNVTITISADNALAYYVDYGINSTVSLVNLPSGTGSKRYTKLGTNTYRITAVVYGKGGTSSTLTKDIIVRSDFTPDPAIVTNLTGGTSKTWAVDPSVSGQFGVGPWSNSSVTPEWWSAAVNEKVACCNCFYTAHFTFTKNSNGTYTLAVTTPDGAFTKTGSLANGLPGIPSSGGEACYAYGGGSGTFTFIPASTGLAASTPSTQTSVLLAGVNTFIGYGALQKEYEIMVLTSTYMYLRVQGTETGNAWYLKLKAL
ncbi:hypothetical protein GALL_46350 [mine drainage metagenome]|uniref:Uncharacterized protein n=1 Tax=mine drainage metagenome TaxID=410659 RepID=A0A1J5TQC0_9ZZZZ